MHVYDGIKHIGGFNYTKENFQKHFISGWEDSWKPYFRDTEFTHPIWDDLVLDDLGFPGALREMTPEETKIAGLVPLYDGEYLDSNNKLIIVDMPKDLLKPAWNREMNTWFESATDVEIAEHIRLENLKYVNEKIEDTNKFDLLNYRNLITSKGDSLEEMDAYRIQLLDIQYTLVNSAKNKSTRTKRSVSFAVEQPYSMPKKPTELMEKYAYLK